VNINVCLLGAGDWIWVVVFVVAGLISLINQVVAKQREQREAAERAARRAAAQAQGARPGQGQPARPGRPAAPQAQPQQPASLEDEIGDFLRRAAQGRAGKGQAAPARPAQQRPAQAGRQALPPRPAQGRPAQARPRQTRPAQAQPIPVAEVVEPAARPVGGQVESRVSRDIDTRKFDQRAERLGKQARTAAEKTQARTDQVFRQEIGTLAAKVPSAESRQKRKKVAGAAVPATSAAGFAAMLRDVNNVRQAIILNEILTRPVDRW
jgi:hypothetical protein